MLRFFALFVSWKVAVTVISHVILIGCADIVSKSDPSDEATILIQQSMNLQRGMTKNEVHAIVGLPYNKSEHLKYEVFQFTGEYKEYWGMFPIPYVPLLGYQTKAYIPVLLVIYNDDWTVKDFEWDLYRESSSSDREIAYIELDSYILVRTNPDFTGLMLIAPAKVSEHAILEPILEDHCALYIIVPDQPMKKEIRHFVPLNSELFLNNYPLVHPYHFPKNYIAYIAGLNHASDLYELETKNQEFIAFQLPEGIYKLELRGSTGSVIGAPIDSAKGKFTCVAGKTIFADIRVEFIDRGNWKWSKYRIEGEISISDHWPKETKARRQVLIHRDESYGLDYQK